MSESGERIVYVSSKGNDLAEGTKERPFVSIERALKGVEAGTVIVVGEGRYGAVAIMGVRGTAERPIVIRGEVAPAVDLSAAEQLTQDVLVWPLRKALDEGKLSLAPDAKACCIDGEGAEVGLLVEDCAHLRIENLVIRDAQTNLALRGCEQVVVRDCVLCGDPKRSVRSVQGAVLQIQDMKRPPNRFIRFQRVLAYGLKENGFCVQPGAAYDVEWDSCVAHSMDSNGGDGFSFSHVTPTDSPDHHPGRMFPNGIDYRMRLVRCAALRNRLDGFDLGQGVGGLTLEYCLGDGNGWGAYYAKDIKIWSSNNTLRRSRMTGRILFVRGVNTMEDFKTGVKEEGPEDERKGR